MIFDNISRMAEEAIPAVHVVAQTTISSQNKMWSWEGGINNNFIFKQTCS